MTREKLSNQTNCVTEPERILAEHRLVERLRRGPVEEDERYRELRGEQEKGQELVRKGDAW